MDLLTNALTCWSPVGIQQNGGTGTHEETTSIRNEFDRAPLNSSDDAEQMYDTYYLNNLDLQCDASPYGLIESYGCKCMFFTSTTPTPEWYEYEPEQVCHRPETDESFRLPSWFQSGRDETFELDWESLIEEGTAAGEDISFGLFPESKEIDLLKNEPLEDECQLYELYLENFRCEDCCRKELQQLDPKPLSFGRQLYWDNVRTLEPRELLSAQTHIGELCYV